MLKFCVSIDHLDWTRGRDQVDRTVQLARMVDQAGFDSLWLNEDPDGWDAFALLGALSRETRHIRLGTGVTSPYHRHPNLIAASVATLDRLAPSRAFLGLGRGQPEWYDRSLGIPAGSAVARLEETILLLGQWWEDPPVASIEGEFRVRNWRRAIVPASKPPIYIAAVGPKALRLAGRLADGVLFNELATPEFIAWAIDLVKFSARSAGRNDSDLLFFANPAVRITDKPAEVLERKKALVAIVHALPGMDRLLMNPSVDVDSIMKRVRALMKTEDVLSRGGAFADFRAEGDLEAALAVVPAELVERGTAIGSLDLVRAKLREFEATGITHVFIDRRGMPDGHEALTELVQILRQP